MAIGVHTNDTICMLMIKHMHMSQDNAHHCHRIMHNDVQLSCDMHMFHNRHTDCVICCQSIMYEHSWR